MAKAKDPFAFKFGANAKPKKRRKTGASKKASKPRTGGRGNAWRAYVGGGISNAPIPY